jgi:transcriptional regulator with XRE-family HTH domain
MCVGMETHNESTTTRYAAFGARLAELRQAMGYSQQSELAAALDTTQQTVSRWEAGLSRPRPPKMSRLAEVLGVDQQELIQLTKPRNTPPVTIAFDQPFPIDALPPESFERFCHAFVQALYREAEVHRAGGTGHKQDGIDIEARLPDHSVYTFQCKRVQEFGPQKVHAAVGKHTVAATKKILLISRVASPQAREAIRQHADWDIWDKDDISTKIRRLPKVDQLQLVDTFFKGKRFELLGESEAGPWETIKEFFAPFENSRGLFNHAWTLVGRDEPARSLTAALDDPEVRCVLLIGSGGAGKTRVLKQVIERYEVDHRGVTVRFLSRTSEVTKSALEGLGYKPALIIVDDAHDRNDLAMLFQYVASTPNSTKLLLAFRPYGLDGIKAQASTFSLVEPSVKEVPLAPLTLGDAEALATQVLQKRSGPLQAAKDIARMTLDCPLATVIGAQVVAQEKTLYDLAKNEMAFRTTLFGRFQDIIAGEIGSKADAGPIKQVLKVLALLQPFHPDDSGLLQAIERIEKVPPHETSRLIKLLTNGGVLFKRGAKYRLSPDVLTDYLIEANCIGVEGKSTGYAELVFSAIGFEHVENFLVNLGQLDWRLSNGDATNSQLLDDIWREIAQDTEHTDLYMGAVSAVAYYQPAKALEFAERLIRHGKNVYRLPELLKYAAFNMRYVTRACEDLWEIAKADDSSSDLNPNEAIRTLAELCEVRPNKPYEYNQTIVDFGLSLMERAESWTHRFTPLDIVAPILKTEAYTVGGNNRMMSFKPYFVNEKFVAILRDKVIVAILGLLSHQNTKIAVLAARQISEALRYPMGQFGATVSPATRDRWTGLFVETLKALERVAAGNIDPVVRYVITREIAWHADYGPDETKEIARRIRRALPKSLDFRVLCTLMDGYGVELRRINPENHLQYQEKRLATLVDEILKAHPNGEALRVFIAGHIDHIEASDPEKAGSPFILCNKLIFRSVEFARAVIEDACSDAPSSVAKFAAAALVHLWQRDVAEGRKIVEHFLKSGREDLLAAIGYAYEHFDFNTGRHGTEELATLKLILSSDRLRVAHAGINALRRLSQADIDAAISLAPFANIGPSRKLADELACIFTWPQHVPLNRLTENDLQAFLEKLMAVPELEGHWLETFLSEASRAFPARIADFFMLRVDRAVQMGGWQYRPCNHGPYGHVPLRIRETREYGPLLIKVMGWIKDAKYESEQKLIFNYRSRELFETLFGSFDGEVIQHLDAWSATADKNDMQLIANILHEVPPDFVFTQAPFVERLLERAKRVDAESVKRVATGLFNSAISGVRQGTPGEPFPRDLEMKARAESVLRSISRFSPAHQLYEGLKAYAESGIERARLDREAFEE